MATELAIVQGGDTNTTWIELAISGYGSSDTTMQFKNGVAGTYSDAEPVRSRKHWELPREPGTHVVYVKTSPSADEDSASIVLNADEITDALHANLSSIYDRDDPILRALLGALGVPMNGVVEMSRIAADQQNTLTARGTFLDSWGRIYRVPRYSGEEDVDYADRIVQTIVSPKLTADAVITAVKRLIPTDPENFYLTEYSHRIILNLVDCAGYDLDDIRRAVRRVKAHGVKASYITIGGS